MGPGFVVWKSRSDSRGHQSLPARRSPSVLEIPPGFADATYLKSASACHMGLRRLPEWMNEWMGTVWVEWGTHSSISELCLGSAHEVLGSRLSSAGWVYWTSMAHLAPAICFSKNLSYRWRNQLLSYVANKLSYVCTVPPPLPSPTEFHLEPLPHPRKIMPNRYQIKKTFLVSCLFTTSW